MKSQGAKIRGAMKNRQARRSGALREAAADVADNVLSGSAGKKNFGDAGFFKAGDVGLGNDAPDKDHYIIHPLSVEERH